MLRGRAVLCDRRVRSVERCVRSWRLTVGRSDRWRFERSQLNLGEHVDGAGRSDAVERVRSSRKTPSEGVQRLYSFGMLINTCWLALEEGSGDF
jgi:hypothetical protein